MDNMAAFCMEKLQADQAGNGASSRVNQTQKKTGALLRLFSFD